MPAPLVVVDASALVERLLDSRRGRTVGQVVGNAQMAAPDHVDVEVLSALRGLERARSIDPARAEAAVEDLADSPLRRMSLAPLLRPLWGLRHELSIYDAGYVALAGALGCVLVTGDRRLERAVGEVLSVALI